MNEKMYCVFIITVIILAAILAISVGYNIRFRGSIADNNRLGELQRESERTIAELTAERDAERHAAGELRSLNREAITNISDALNATAATGPSLTRANELLRSAITALQHLEVLYHSDSNGGGGGLDFVGGE